MVAKREYQIQLLSEGVDFENPYFNFIKQKGYLPDDRDANYSKPETFIKPDGNNPSTVETKENDRIIRLPDERDVVDDIIIRWENTAK